MIRRYSELILLPTIEERFNYLRLNGVVGKSTFGFDRYLNQVFYRSKEWGMVRDQVIVRDLGHDMALEDSDYEIFGPIVVHHMNPISVDNILKHSADILNPEYLVCVSEKTHRAIHYGDESQLPKIAFEERKPGDTCPWR
jgi:hypothetical protein